MVSAVSVLKGCRSVQQLPSLLNNELLGQMFSLFPPQLKPRAVGSTHPLTKIHRG